jgi:predicted transcriptional regulator
VQLLSAYLANNTIASEDLAELIRSTRAALTGEVAADAAPAAAETFTPAVSVRKSLASSEHIISLIDGRPYKTLKRHLASHGLTPETYRSRYNLPASYPMVAPDYAAQRREVAQKTGLGGRKPTPQAPSEQDVPAAAEATPDEPVIEAQDAPVSGSVEEPRKTTRGRPRKADKASEATTAAGEASGDTDAPTGDGAATKPARASRGAKKGAAKPARTKAKTAPAGAGPGTEASPGDAASPATEASEPAAPEASAGEKPKRRGRLGLFKKQTDAQDGSSEQAAEASDDAGESTSKRRQQTGSGRAKKPKRMARAADPKADAADETSGTPSA